MSNWVTLPNGVHIDLDDPHNPVTGDGDWSDLGGGDKSSGGKGSAKSKIDTSVPDVTSTTVSKAKENFKKRVEKLSPKERDYANEQLKDFLGTHEEIDAYDHVSTLIDNGSVSYFANKSSKAKSTPKEDGEFYEWYNSLSKEDRAFIDRSMGADKEEGAKYEKGNPALSGKDSKSFDRDLERAFKEFGNDEDAILDALRSTGKDYGMSNGDLQSVVEAYVLRKGSSKSNDDGPSTFAMAKEMGMKASDLYGVTEKEIRERYRAFKKGK